MYYFLTFIFCFVGVLAFIDKKHNYNKLFKRIVGIAFVLIGLCFLSLGLSSNDWSAESDNWNNINKFEDHVTEEDADIKKVYSYHGYLVMKVDGLNFRNKDMYAANQSLESMFQFANKTKLSNKGLIVYQGAKDNNQFAILYNKKALKNYPSHDQLDDNMDLLLDKATAYRMSGGAFNSSKFTTDIPINSKNQPKVFSKFCDSKGLYVFNYNN